ncbi:MAG: HU family DNA-binding protein [Bacteroidaceae bacterium]
MKGNKINWQDLAADMAASAGIHRKDAEAFVRSFFDVLGDGILADKSVKVKALGTFKLVEVQERESVNVNTGERITISGHSKIGFLPDNALKELVNKPFAYFQTVILNEGTTTEEIEEINRKYPSEEQEEEAPEVPAIITPATEEPTARSEEDVVEETTTEGTMVPSIATPEEQEQTTGETDCKTPPDTTTEKERYGQTELYPGTEEKTTQIPTTHMKTEENRHKHNIWRTLFLTLVSVLVMIACYMAGYLRLVDMSWLCMPPAAEPTETPAETTRDGQEGAQKKATEALPEKSEAREETTPQVQTEKEPSQTDRNKFVEASKNFPQLAGGKYLIVGILKTRAMKRGDNLYRMAREEYGDKSIAEYIKALNQFSNPDNIPIGYEVKLPELYEMGK